MNNPYETVSEPSRRTSSSYKRISVRSVSPSPASIQSLTNCLHNSPS